MQSVRPKVSLETEAARVAATEMAEAAAAMSSGQNSGFNLESIQEEQAEELLDGEGHLLGEGGPGSAPVHSSERYRLYLSQKRHLRTKVSTIKNDHALPFTVLALSMEVMY